MRDSSRDFSPENTIFFIYRKRNKKKGRKKEEEKNRRDIKKVLRQIPAKILKSIKIIECKMTIGFFYVGLIVLWCFYRQFVYKRGKKINVVSRNMRGNGYRNLCTTGCANLYHRNVVALFPAWNFANVFRVQFWCTILPLKFRENISCFRAKRQCQIFVKMPMSMLRLEDADVDV